MQKSELKEAIWYDKPMETLPKSQREFWLLFLVLICFGLILIFYKYFNKTSQTIQSPLISAAIIPHHDLAENQRKALLAQVAAQIKPPTIIIVSPNHFEAGGANIITTNKTWKLENAVVEPNTDKIVELTNDGSILNDEAAFSREHGITNVLSDINLNFPDAKIIPIIIKQSTNKESIGSLANKLDQICRGCLLIVSVDFSHYQPGALAEIHDIYSIKTLENLDEEGIYKAEVDSQQSLALAIKWAKLNQTETFHLVENTNSAKLLNEPDSESTSYVLGWYEAGQSNINSDLAFMLAGDTMFARYVDYRYRGKNLKNVFANLGERFFWGTDLSILNLEGPISIEDTSPSLDPNNLIFHFPPETANVLGWLNLNAVNLANNHTLNGGEEELANTQKMLRDRGIKTIGTQNSLGIETIDKVTIITLNTGEVSTDISKEIVVAKQTGSFIIIFVHWGNEYQKTHSSAQQRLAHTWIDQGADLIVGSHPHVIQDAETYKNRPIFYSLGNFLFDQYFSGETQKGLVLAGGIKDNKLKLVLIPININKDLQPEILRGEDKQKIIDQLKEGMGITIGNNDYGHDIIEIEM